MASGYIYNNEAIATVILGHYLSITNHTDAATAMTILPFVLHEPTVRRLRSQSNKRSIEEFVSQYSDCLVNYNTRFLDFLPLSINAITILYESKVIYINGEKIRFNTKSEFNPVHVGNRAENIFKANEALSRLFQNESPSSLYLKLKIQL